MKYVAEIQRLFAANAERLLPSNISSKGVKVIRMGVDDDDRAMK